MLLEPDTVVNIAVISVEVVPMNMGFKYVSFRLKPNKYGIEDWEYGIKDWNWLIEKFERRLYVIGL